MQIQTKRTRFLVQDSTAYFQLTVNPPEAPSALPCILEAVHINYGCVWFFL